MIHAYTRHTRLTSFEEAQEAFNRECHSDALREMQLVPAEEMQIPLVGATVPTWIYPATAALFFLAIVIWSNAQ